MEFGFLFWLFLGGILVAGFQDLKRREVDNWLNLFLLVASLAYVFFDAILSGSGDVIFHVGFLLVVMFGVMNLFYYGRVFAGGDAKLLFAMTVVFLGATFWGSMINIGVFVLFLLISGSIYGIFYSGVLWYKNREKVNAEMGKLVREKRWWFTSSILVGIVFILFGIFKFVFFLIGFWIILFPLLLIFAKGLENVSMIRGVSGGELREGDWLVNDIVVEGRRSQVAGRRVVRADWEGISLEDIELLKDKKKVWIKEGLPFVPAFLIAFLGYWFLRGWVILIFIG